MEQILEKLEIVKIKDEEADCAASVRTEEEKRAKKRENSFVRDGYEIYLEGTYIVNGRVKKKIKKRWNKVLGKVNIGSKIKSLVAGKGDRKGSIFGALLPKSGEKKE